LNPEAQKYILSLKNLPVHPHNNSLQAYFELGIIGEILYALLLRYFEVFKEMVSLAAANAMATLLFLNF